jgi:hypothetical protein
MAEYKVSYSCGDAIELLPTEGWRIGQTVFFAHKDLYSDNWRATHINTGRCLLKEEFDTRAECSKAVRSIWDRIPRRYQKELRQTQNGNVSKRCARICRALIREFRKSRPSAAATTED